jgi:hypothetical protein
MNEDTLAQIHQARDVAVREIMDACVEGEDSGTIEKRIMTAQAMNEKLLLAEGECRIEGAGMGGCCDG